LNTVCVFCGSSPGAHPEYIASARSFGRLLAEQGVRIVYGGGRVGLMGAVADAAMEAGGSVIGVIPHALMAREVGHGGVTDLRVVETMHERKALMADISDGFVALPGGIGTLEEFFEIWTWGQLGIHDKPIGLLDVRGFYAPMALLLDHLVEQEFLAPRHRGRVLRDDSAESLLERMRAFVPPETRRWVDLDQA
jgi:uncharacterized protein (TIGR00730 family)